jgi:hypothetical protein
MLKVLIRPIPYKTLGNSLLSSNIFSLVIVDLVARSTILFIKCMLFCWNVGFSLCLGIARPKFKVMKYFLHIKFKKTKITWNIYLSNFRGQLHLLLKMYRLRQLTKISRNTYICNYRTRYEKIQKFSTN